MTAWRRSTASKAISARTPSTAPASDAGNPPNVFRALPGRTLLLSSATLLVLWIVQQVVALPASVQLLRRIVALVLIGSGGWTVGALIARNHRRFLWRVRRKLLLSYLFLGVVPIVLVLAFALAGGVVLYDNLAGYLLRQGVGDVVEEVQSIAATAAAEISRNAGAAPAVATNRYDNWSAQYPDLSIAVLPTGAALRGAALTAGPWRHAAPPGTVPSWVPSGRGFGGVVSVPVAAEDGKPRETRLVLRSAVPTSDRRRVVVVDLPLTVDVVARIEDRTGVRILDAGRSVPDGGSASTPDAAGQTPRALPVSSRAFQRTVGFVDVTDWETGKAARTAIDVEAPIGRLSQRIAAVQSAQFGSNVTRGLVIFLVGLALLFAIIQGAALVMGGALARSITHAVHELFVGTERIRQGDFAHRIRVETEDQLGELADSFNRMSGSIEHLLHVQREKQRLDDELRIAREIQKSLLPERPPAVPGLSIVDLCEPAREVGGDYYDFFQIGSRQLGVLIADVSGKGTSAALYMAELKGLMLALSQTERSPRRLLTAANNLLAAHLDNRSFITATYAVIDLERMTLTIARAGHTPMIVVSDGACDVVVPGGMVLGLRLPGASERFEALLEEHTRPLTSGDLIVLYTDGITEAMNIDGDLFGDEALARVLCATSGQDPPAIRERIIREVRAFVGDAEPHDDMTMVLVRVE